MASPAKHRKQQLTFNARLLPWLLALLAVMQFFYPYRGWTILLVALGGLWLISYLWASRLACSLTLQREKRFGWAHVGDRLEERFTLTNSDVVPALWVEIEDHSTLPNYTTSRVTGVGGQSQNRWHTQGICRQRGIFNIGPTTLHSSDPFGLYRIKIELQTATTLTVTPPIVPLPAIDVAPGGRVGEGRARPNAFERTVSSSSIRQYVSGDSLSWVHWPTSARQGKLYVRQFDSTPSGDWWIFLDVNQAVQSGQGFNRTEEHAVILAASLADRGLRQRRAVGLVAAGRNELVWLPPAAAGNQQQQILQALAQLAPGRRSLAHLLTHSRAAARKMASLIIITADGSAAWVETLIPLLRRGVTPTVLLLDGLTFGGPTGVAPAQPLLDDLGMTNFVIPKSLLDHPETRGGRQGRWEWQITPSGRAVPISAPRDMSWHTLQEAANLPPQ